MRRFHLSPLIAGALILVASLNVGAVMWLMQIAFRDAEVRVAAACESACNFAPLPGVIGVQF